MQLIGREAPLGVLRAALTRGTGAVLVRGEPGIGKTSLVDALAREAAAHGHRAGAAGERGAQHPERHVPPDQLHPRSLGHGAGNGTAPGDAGG